MKPHRPHPNKDRPTKAKGAVWKPGPGAQVVGAEAGMDLAHFIAMRIDSSLSVRAIRRALDAGSCRVNGGSETFGSRILKRHDVVEFIAPNRRPQDHDFDRRRLLHEDTDIVAYDKPAGLPVTPDDEGKKWNLLAMLKGELGFLIAVHRLDADTSGLVIMARNEKTARRLEDLFRGHDVKKTYLALVRGHPRESGTYRSYLVKVGSQKGQEKWRSGRGPDAREAVTNWKVIERVGPYASLVQVEPDTGRYHQIRIHFSEMGHSIYGDRIYGDRQDPIHVTRHLLHAWKISVPSLGGKPLELKTPMPREFEEAKRLLARL